MAKKAKLAYDLYKQQRGNMENLNTTNKNNLVAAINEGITMSAPSSHVGSRKFLTIRKNKTGRTGIESFQRNLHLFGPVNNTAPGSRRRGLCLCRPRIRFRC